MDEQKKTVKICMRLTSENKRALEERANERNLTLTDFLTRAGLGRATRQRVDVDAINLLRDCANELKSIHVTMRNLNSKDIIIDSAGMNAQMEAITAAIGRVWTNANNC